MTDIKNTPPVNNTDNIDDFVDIQVSVDGLKGIFTDTTSEESGKPVFLSQDAPLSQFMTEVAPPLNVDYKIPTKSKLKSTAESTNSVPTCSSNVLDDKIFIEEKFDPESGHVLSIGRTIDDEGNIVNISGNFNTEDLLSIRSHLAESIPEVFEGFTPFSPDPAKVEKIRKRVEVLLKSGGVTQNRIPPIPLNIQLIIDELIGLGPLAPLIKDPDISDILVVSFDRIFVERKGRLFKAEGVKFQSPLALKTLVERIAITEGRQLSLTKPILEMQLADGSRVSVVGPPLTENDGHLLTIRRHKNMDFSLRDLLIRETISAEMEQYLSDIVAAQANILLCGGTGAGKTTALKALASAKSPDEAVITIEDTRELRLPHENTRALTPRMLDTSGSSENIDMRRLVKTALRMRPTSIIIGETRDETAYDILVAMSTGHDGCMTTVHANNSHSALRRLELLARQAEERPPIETLRESIVECFDVVISIQRQFNGERKVASIDEVVGYDPVKDTYVLRNVFRYVAVNKPDEPMRFRFIKNPKYYTSPGLQVKLRAFNKPYTTAPDGAEEYQGTLIADEVRKMEREADLLRSRQQKQEQKEKLAAWRESMRIQAKSKRKQERQRERQLATLRRHTEREIKKEEARKEKDRLYKEKQLKRITARARHRAIVKATNAKTKIEAELIYEQQKQFKESISQYIESELLRFEKEERDRLLKESPSYTDVDISRTLAVSLALYKDQLENKYKTLNPWQKRNLSKGMKFYEMISSGVSFEDVAKNFGVSVNAILKYIRIIDNDMVNTYLKINKKFNTPKRLDTKKEEPKTEPTIKEEVEKEINNLILDHVETLATPNIGLELSTHYSNDVALNNETLFNPSQLSTTTTRDSMSCSLSAPTEDFSAAVEQKENKEVSIEELIGLDAPSSHSEYKNQGMSSDGEH